MTDDELEKLRAEEEDLRASLNKVRHAIRAETNDRANERSAVKVGDEVKVNVRGRIELWLVERIESSNDQGLWPRYFGTRIRRDGQLGAARELWDLVSQLQHDRAAVVGHRDLPALEVSA